MLKLFSRLLDHRIEAYQRELIETHYKEVDNMYRQMRGWRHRGIWKASGPTLTSWTPT